MSGERWSSASILRGYEKVDPDADSAGENVKKREENDGERRDGNVQDRGAV